MSKYIKILFVIVLGFQVGRAAIDGSAVIGFQGNKQEDLSGCFIYGHGVRLGCQGIRRFLSSDRLSP